jgi:hypothetical protein
MLQMANALPAMQPVKKRRTQLDSKIELSCQNRNQKP